VRNGRLTAKRTEQLSLRPEAMLTRGLTQLGRFIFVVGPMNDSHKLRKMDDSVDLSLPDDLLREMLLQVSMKDAAKLLCVSKQFAKLKTDDSLWKSVIRYAHCI
jgi:hypothetical protein